MNDQIAYHPALLLGAVRYQEKEKREDWTPMDLSRRGETTIWNCAK
jgi:hypothetical protein